MKLTERLARAWRAFRGAPPATFAVVTRVPDMEDASAAKGNLALRVAYHPEAGTPISTPLYGEVFMAGELLIMDADGHREEVGEQRCPGKWDVDVELFDDDLAAAVTRANEVIRESWKGLVTE